MSVTGLQTIEQEGKQRYILDYQAKDADGNAIGSPTHLEADTIEELLEKQRQSHEHAVRLVAKQNRVITDLKSRSPRAKGQEPTFQPRKLTPEETTQATLEMQNPKTAVAATRTLMEAASPLADIEATVKQAHIERANALGQQAAYAFMQRHLEDYLPCEANNQLMVDYLNKNSLDLLDHDNWEIAYQAVQDRLAQRPKPKNQLSDSELEVAVEAPPANNDNARRLPASGIVPGGGQRTTVARTGQKTMTPAEMRELYRKNKAEFMKRQRTGNWLK